MSLMQSAYAPARLAGVDLARGVAVLGMFAVHVGPDPVGGISRVLEVFHGRAAALFLFLAGVSLSLMSGGPVGLDGPARRRSRIRIAVRAAVLLVLGLALTSLDTSIDVILQCYAAVFLLMLPLLRLRARSLAVLAAVFAIAGPVLSFTIRRAAGWNADSTPSAPGLANLNSWHGVGQGALSVLLNGAYPVLTIMAFTLAGMAVGRLDLSAMTVRVRLILTGTALLATGYAGSAVLMSAFNLFEKIGGGSAVAGERLVHSSEVAERGTVPTSSWAWLFTAGPHSGTPMEVLGATGCALVVVGAALLVTDHTPRALVPLTALGMMGLTAYTGHLVAVWLISDDGDLPTGWITLAVFTVTTLVFAVVWLRLFRRGPLESLLRTASHAVARRFSPGVPVTECKDP